MQSWPWGLSTCFQDRRGIGQPCAAMKIACAGVCWVSVLVHGLELFPEHDLSFYDPAGYGTWCGLHCALGGRVLTIHRMAGRAESGVQEQWCVHVLHGMCGMRVRKSVDSHRIADGQARGGWRQRAPLEDCLSQDACSCIYSMPVACLPAIIDFVWCGVVMGQNKLSMLSPARARTQFLWPALRKLDALAATSSPGRPRFVWKVRSSVLGGAVSSGTAVCLFVA